MSELTDFSDAVASISSRFGDNVRCVYRPNGSGAVVLIFDEHTSEELIRKLLHEALPKRSPESWDVLVFPWDSGLYSPAGQCVVIRY